jgi:hypothetical protein
MRRFVLVSVAALSLVGGAIGASRVASGSTAPTVPSETATGVHPIVGAWLLTVDEFPGGPPQLVAAHADGTYHQVDSANVTGIGSWEATGPNSFNVTFNAQFTRDDVGSVWMQTLRGTGEVSEDGQSFTAEFTVEYAGQGAPAGEYGPAHVTATRISIEPMSTPAGSLDDLFAQLGGAAPAGTAPAGSAAVGTTPTGTMPAGTEPMGTTPSDAAVATTTG